MQKTPVVSKELLIPFVLITTLFALWGFANAVTDPMVSAFKKVLELNNAQASLVQMAFYGGYFCMAIPASLFVRKHTYKAGIIVGLALYATGALLFYPAAVTGQFVFFLMGLYVLTFGLAFLETTANPYILALGDESTATRRLNLAQAFNPVGLLVGLLVARQFVLKRLQSDDVDFGTISESAKAAITQADLLVIRNPYVALGLFVLFILVLIVLNKMPEKQDEGKQLPFGVVFKKLLKSPRYSEGILTQAFYVGAQIMCWTYIYQYGDSIGLSGEKTSQFQFVAFLLFFIGRFLFTYLLKFISSGRLLTILSVLAIFFTACVIFVSGIVGLYSLVMISFCMSLMFPTIYGMAMTGLSESEVKIGAAGLVMAIVGGALMPTLQGLILDIGGSGFSDTIIMGVPEINFTFVLPMACFLAIAL